MYPGIQRSGPNGRSGKRERAPGNVSRNRFWITLVDVHPGTPDNSEWLAAFGDSASGGFVHVMGLAKTPEALHEAIGRELAGHGWRAASFDDTEPLAALKGRESLSEAFEEMEKALLRTGDLQFGRFFLYPAEELSTPEWLALEAEDRRLTITQSTVLTNLSRMLQSLTLPQLDHSVGVTGQGTDALHIHLPHRDEAELDLTILVTSDTEITVDYEYGHLHFNREVGTDWVDQALDFLYGALQGGVKVEIWSTDGRLEHSRALILLENGDWHPFPLWSTTPTPGPSGEPTVVKVLSFLGGQAPGPGP